MVAAASRAAITSTTLWPWFVAAAVKILLPATGMADYPALLLSVAVLGRVPNGKSQFDGNRIDMKKKISFVMMLEVVFVLPATLMVACKSHLAAAAKSGRPQGPCDIYAAGGTPCVAAHSTTRALSASYNDPLYQIMRQSDGKSLNIGVVQPSAIDAGGYADAAAQDAFCANTICFIKVIYDQSGKGNHLCQAPPGTFKGPDRKSVV